MFENPGGPRPSAPPLPTPLKAHALLFYLLLFLTTPSHIREDCRGSSSRLSRHTSRSSTNTQHL